MSFLEDQDVNLISLGENDDKRSKSWAPVGEETVLAALDRVVDSSHYPVLITCSTGKHRTGKGLMCTHEEVARQQIQTKHGSPSCCVRVEHYWLGQAISLADL